jgi:amino acid transporter
MSESDFSRELGFVDATSIGLGTMIGGGIFILPSIAAAQAGPASSISFAIAGVVSLLSALSHAEVATDMQDVDGGSYEYVYRALGPMLGSVVGWGMWIGLIFATAFYAVGFAQYVTFFSGSLPIAPVAVVLALALVGLNYYGAAEAGEIEDAIVVILLVLIVAFVGGGTPAIEGDRLQPFNPNGWAAVLTTTGTIYVSFIGFALIGTAAAEIENPARNLPLSMLTAVAVPTVLYVFVMIVSTGVLPAEALQGSRIPVADVAAQYAGDLGALGMVVGAALATISSANASILAASRVSYAMGGDRLLTQWLETLSSRFGTPARAILATGAGIVALLVLPVTIDLLAEVASFMFLITYGLVHVAVVRLRGTEGYDPHFRIPSLLYPAAPILGMLATLGIMSQMDPIVIAFGGVLVVAGVAWYLVYVRFYRDDGGDESG